VPGACATRESALPSRPRLAEACQRPSNSHRVRRSYGNGRGAAPRTRTAEAEPQSAEMRCIVSSSRKSPLGDRAVGEPCGHLENAGLPVDLPCLCGPYVVPYVSARYVRATRLRAPRGLVCV
jgi:hypothetical protein